MRGILLAAVFLTATVLSHAQFPIILQFSDMNPHVGQMLGIRVTERESGLEAARLVIPEITQPAFNVTILCGRADVDYNVDFFADLNMNGLYDAPPTDHAWRELVGIINNGAEVEFIHNLNFTDIMWPNPTDPPVSSISRKYAGKWNNTTFETEGDATASFDIDYVAGTGIGSITTAGAFGNPEEVTFSGTGPYFAENDSLAMAMQAPYAGVIFFVRGEVAGVILNPTANVSMSISGNYGDDQLMFTYDLTQPVEAEGYFSMQSTEVTSVDEEVLSGGSLSAYPNPAQDLVTITWDQALGRAQAVSLVSTSGHNSSVSLNSSSAGHASIDISALSNGTYQFIVSVGSKQVTGSVVINR